MQRRTQRTIQEQHSIRIFYSCTRRPTTHHICAGHRSTTNVPTPTLVHRHNHLRALAQPGLLQHRHHHHPPTMPYFVLPAYMAAKLRLIQREHFNVIYEIACTPINTTGINTTPAGNYSPQMCEPLDPEQDSATIIPRLRELIHRYFIRKALQCNRLGIAVQLH